MLSSSTGQAGVRSIARFARGGIHDPSHTSNSACFTKIDRAQHIASRIELRIGDRSVDVDLRGEVEDDVRVRACDDASQFWSLNVGLHQCKSTCAHVIAAERMLEVCRNAGPEVVDANHLVAVGQEAIDQNRSDEPGRAGDQGFA